MKDNKVVLKTPNFEELEYRKNYYQIEKQWLTI